MNFMLPDKVKGNQTSLIRYVAERGMNIPGFISFALGNPTKESIPVELLQKCSNDVFSENPMSVLQYGPSTGDTALAEWVKERVTTRKGCPKEEHKVMLLTGSGKALGYVPRALCSEGDEAFCDSFTFPNAYNSMRNAGVIPVGIPHDNKGMIPAELEKQAKRGKGKYVYLIPNFHNPLGMTMPLDRRKELYEIARKYNLIIYEDDPYGDIRFSGEEVPTIKSLDEDGRVIYVGSFSKTLSAGLRVGFLYAADELVQALSKVRGSDGQDPLYNQKIITKCLQNMDYDEHLKKISLIYKHKCDLMVENLKKYCDPACEILIPEGGMFVWIEMPEGIDIDAVSEKCLEAGVGVVKSKAFAVDTSHPSHAFRLNFSACEDQNIEKGIRIFGQITKESISAI